jgi:hypothetical protein
MRGFVLTSSIVPGTPYFEAIWPITEPLFAAYADKWEMEWRPHFATPQELAEFETSPAPQGTGAVYAGILHRWRHLTHYKGVVFLDSDAVIMDYTYDICREVDEQVPMAAGGNFNGAVVVMRSCERTEMFLTLVWEQREKYRHYQWLEQAAMMELMGFDGNYPGDDLPSAFLGDTEWTPLWSQLSGRWNAHPMHPQEVQPLIFHPGGVQPFEKRRGMVLDAAQGILPAPWRNDLPRI